MGESLVKVPGVEDKMGGSVTPNGALEVSISFGRFENDSLSWEKWSTFSPNKYLEEVEKCSTPGSVAQKKAYFEAHYKKIAARKAELLEQDNMMGTDSSRSNEMNCSDHSTSTSGTDAERGTLNGHGFVEEVDLDTNSLSEVSSGFVNESAEGDVNASECLSSLVESIVEEVPEKLQSEEVKCPEKADLVTEDILKISEEVQDTEGKPLKMDSEMINVVKANEKRSEFNAHHTAQKVPQTKNEENLANTMTKKKPVLPAAKSYELSTPKTRRSSKPVLSSTPRSSKPVLSSTPRSSKVVSTSTPKLSKPVSASTPRSTKPVSASTPRSSKPESAATPKLSKPVFTSSPTLSKAVSTSAPRLSRPAPASTSRLSKPISTSIVRPVSHSSTRKPNVLPSQKSKDSSATTIKLAAPTSLHKSVDSVSITTNKKSLIMEQMGDKEIVKRAFKSFQSNLNQLQPSRVDKPHGPRPVSARGSEHQVSGFVTSQKENDRTRKITAHRLPSGTDWSTTSSRSLIETGAQKYIKTDSSSGGPKIDERAEKRKAFFKNLEEKSNARDEEKRHHNSKSKETVQTSSGHA